MLRFEHVYKRYPDAGEALTDINFDLSKGEMAFLTGRSGAGKSTLLKLIAMMEQCTRGTIMLDGQNISRISDRKIPYLRRNLGLIFQDYKLLNDRTVFDNVALPLIVSGINHQEVSRRVRASLDKVSLLGKEKKYPLHLSGGEQQRVGIARAIVNKPKLILADEPTGRAGITTNGSASRRRSATTSTLRSATCPTGTPRWKPSKRPRRNMVRLTSW